MSLPPLVRWEYDYQPAAGFAGGRVDEYYLQDRDWLAEVVQEEAVQ